MLTSGIITSMSTIELELPMSLAKLQQTLRKYGVIQADVFGSYARGEQTSESDLDLLVRCRTGVSLFDVFDLQHELEKSAGIKVDIATELKDSFKEYIEPELVNIPL